jgi:putative phosphoribosyl transferase
MSVYDDIQFDDRRDAGRLLAQAVEDYELVDPVVLALPRGGVPIGYEVAARLHAPLDVVMVRKLGAPGQPELAIGAVVDGDDPQTVFNPEIIQHLHVTERTLAKEVAEELKEIARREQLYRRERKAVPVKGATAIIVDDGIATGASMRAAIRGVKRKSPASTILAVPVASRMALQTLKPEVDAVVCLRAPSYFGSVGAFYRDFEQTSDEEVAELLLQAERWKRPAKPSRVGR